MQTEQCNYIKYFIMFALLQKMFFFLSLFFHLKKTARMKKRTEWRKMHTKIKCVLYMQIEIIVHIACINNFFVKKCFSLVFIHFAIFRHVYRRHIHKPFLSLFLLFHEIHFFLSTFSHYSFFAAMCLHLKCQRFLRSVVLLSCWFLHTVRIIT